MPLVHRVLAIVLKFCGFDAPGFEVASFPGLNEPGNEARFEATGTQHVL